MKIENYDQALQILKHLNIPRYSYLKHKMTFEDNYLAVEYKEVDSSHCFEIIVSVPNQEMCIKLYDSKEGDVLSSKMYFINIQEGFSKENVEDYIMNSVLCVKGEMQC